MGPFNNKYDIAAVRTIATVEAHVFRMESVYLRHKATRIPPNALKKARNHVSAYHEWKKGRLSPDDWSIRK